MKPEENDFRLDRKARSFRVSNFSLRDTPLLLLAFLLVAMPGLIMGWLPGRILPESWRWVVPGILVFVALALSVCALFQRRPEKSSHDLSPEIKALAADPANLAAAISRFQVENPGVSPALAKQRIEEFSRSGQ